MGRGRGGAVPGGGGTGSSKGGGTHGEGVAVRIWPKGLTPIPRPVSHTWATQICTSDFSGADPISPIGETEGLHGIRGK